MGGRQGSLLDVYGGEYSFNGYTVSLENSIGSNRGVSVRYGVNMTDFEQDSNCADCYTGVVAYWANDTDVVYSPVVSALGTYGYVKILSVDMSTRWEEKPTEAQLTSAASTYITSNQIGVPKVSWRVNFVPLDTTEEYKNYAVLEQVALGDTVTVKFEKLNVDATARVNSIEWDVLLDRYVSVNLGSVKSNISDTIAGQGKQLSVTPTQDEVEKIAHIVAAKITADYLEATTISANQIEGGTLSLGKQLNEAGWIRIYDEQNHFIGAMYNRGVWFGSGSFSSLQNTTGFTIRKVYDDDGNVQNLVWIGRVADANTSGVDNGIVQVSSVDDQGNKTVNAYITGDGTIVCKALYVNGQPVT